MPKGLPSFILLHLILYYFIPFTFFYFTLFNIVYLLYFWYINYQNRNELLERTHRRACQIIDDKNLVLENYEVNVAKREEKKQLLDSFTTGFRYGGLIFDGGLITSAIATGANISAKSYYDSLNDKAVERLKKLDRAINEKKEYLKRIEQEYYNSLIKYSTYIIAISVYLYFDPNFLRIKEYLFG